MKILGTFISMMALIGCSALVNPTSPVKNEEYSDCGASKFEYLIGKNAKNIENLNALSSETRIIFPGTAVTKDLKPTRLNIHVDRTNLITKVICG